MAATRGVLLAQAIFTVMQLFLYAQSDALSPREPVNSGCLSCICDASTGCNKTIGCNGDLCGLFAITKPFWEDANRPTVPQDEPHRPEAFERCVADPICASETVKNYMEIYARDCNGDGKINCKDYARIHRFGPFDCLHELDPGFDIVFDPCMREVGEPLNNQSDDTQEIPF